MKKVIHLFVALFLILALAACGSSTSSSTPSASASPNASAVPSTPAPPAPEKKFMTLATSPSTSATYAYWVAVAKAITDTYPELQITCSESQGAMDISNRVRNHEVMLGNGVSKSDFENYSGTGIWEGDPNPEARILWYYENATYLGGVPESSSIYTYSDLAGQRVGNGGTGTTLSTIVVSILEELGIDVNFFEAGKNDMIKSRRLANRAV